MDMAALYGGIQVGQIVGQIPCNSLKEEYCNGFTASPFANRS